MICGYCFRNVEETEQSDMTGIEICEECYWLEVEMKVAEALVGEPGESGSGPGYNFIWRQKGG